MGERHARFVVAECGPQELVGTGDLDAPGCHHVSYSRTTCSGSVTAGTVCSSGRRSPVSLASSRSLKPVPTFPPHRSQPSFVVGHRPGARSPARATVPPFDPGRTSGSGRVDRREAVSRRPRRPGRRARPEPTPPGGDDIARPHKRPGHAHIGRLVSGNRATRHPKSSSRTLGWEGATSFRPDPRARAGTAPPPAQGLRT